MKLNLKRYAVPVGLAAVILYCAYAPSHERGTAEASGLRNQLDQITDLNDATAIFAGGCFWSEEEPFERLDGVLSVVTGYTGGHTADPTYAKVSSGRTGHLEAVQVRYDPDRITYDELLQVFWRN